MKPMNTPTHFARAGRAALAASLLLLVGLAATAIAEDPPSKKEEEPWIPGTDEGPPSRCLIIGIARYPASEDALPAVSEPARNLARFFKAGSFKSIVTLFDEEATSEAIRREVDKLTSYPQPSRRIIINYSGWQWKDPASGASFLVPYDGLRDGSMKNLIPMDHVSQRLAQSNAELRAAYFHTCFRKLDPSPMARGFGSLDWKAEMIPVPVGSCAILTCGPEPAALEELGPSAAAPTPATTGSHKPSVRRKGLAYLGLNGQGYEEYKNERDGSILIYVPGGTFCLGHGGRWIDTIPRVRATLSPYLIGKHEVTLGQYKRFCDETPYEMPKIGWWDPADDEPMEEIMWEDAVGYADWAGLRLPTEAEWEYAARGPDGRRFPWGNEPWNAGGTFRANFFGDEELGVTCDKFFRTAPVTAFPEGASPFGCLNMLGNVMEWCADRYDAFAYLTAESTNPQGPSAGIHRTRRGGSWNSPPEEVHAANRGLNHPSEQWEDTGFRIACSP